MQAVTHFLVGVIIQQLVESAGLNPWESVLLIILLGILSHILLDCLAKATYHPAEPKSTLFWKAYHVLVLALSVGVVIIFASKYLLGMLASVIPDIIDWLIIRPAYWKLTGRRDYSVSFFHSKIIDPVREKAFFWVPDLREKPLSAANEMLLVAVLLVTALLLSGF